MASVQTYIPPGCASSRMLLTTQRARYLAAMGIDVWRLRTASAAEEPVVAASASVNLPAAVSVPPAAAAADWERLQQQVATCIACPLHRTRTHTVFGTGNVHAPVMFIGEAPGAEEDRQGKPFVGRAGQLLTEMLRAIDFNRDAVFIANILKCRPPQNRDPRPEEVQQCTPYLQQQIQWIQPRLLVALGRIAAHFLLQTQTPLSRLRGQTFHWGVQQTPLIVTYHPAYLLRSPHDKAKAYSDLLRIRQLLAEPVSSSPQENHDV